MDRSSTAALCSGRKAAIVTTCTSLRRFARGPGGVCDDRGQTGAAPPGTGQVQPGQPVRGRLHRLPGGGAGPGRRRRVQRAAGHPVQRLRGPRSRRAGEPGRVPQPQLGLGARGEDAAGDRDEEECDEHRDELERVDVDKQVFGIKEGFEIAILNQLRWAMSWDDLVNRLTSKRWTAASVNRILIAVLGNITDQQWHDYKTNYAQQPVIRLLAYRERHSHYLKDLRHQSVEIIANWKKDYADHYHLQWRIDQVYQLNPIKKIQDQNLTQYPIKIN